MFKKIPCDWFLEDGVHRPLRLDAPEYVEDALRNTGVIADEPHYEQRTASEWIFRRVWTYTARFGLEPGERRAFVAITHLAGSYSVYINNVLCYQGSDECARFEATGRFTGQDEIRLVFDRPEGEILRPRFGFCGAALYRFTGPAAVTELGGGNDEDGRSFLYSCLDCKGKLKTEIKLSAKSSLGLRESSYRGEQEGIRNLRHGGFDELPAGEDIELRARVYTGGALSDEFVSHAVLRGSTPLRGFEGETEDLMAAAQNAGANAVFVRTESPDVTLRVLAARHNLSVQPLRGIEETAAEDTLMKADRLLEIAGSEKELLQKPLWALTQANKECLDKAIAALPEGETEEVCTYSRIRQALLLRKTAFQARYEQRDMVLVKVDDGYDKPASAALFDRPGVARPAYYALKDAWRPRTAFALAPADLSGKFTCDVVCACDDRSKTPCRVKTELWDPKGYILYEAEFDCTARDTLAGSFPCSLPGDGVGILRTTLFVDGVKTSVSDTVLSSGEEALQNLDSTQLLAADGKITNVGTVAAVNVCVPSAGFFGCLLPGESVLALRGDPDTAEGINIFI